MSGADDAHSGQPYFLTISIVEWLDHATLPSYFEELIRSTYKYNRNWVLFWFK